MTAEGADCTVGRRDCDGPGTYRCDEVVWGSPCRAWQARNGGYRAPDEVETADPTPAERIAQAFHEAYEQLAPSHGYATREASAKPWREVPVRNRRLMIATVGDLLARAVALPGSVSPPRIGPRGTVILAGPEVEYEVGSLETAGPNAVLRLQTVDGLDWSAERPPRSGDPEPLRRPDRDARAVFVDDPDPAGLAAARVGIEHVLHHGQPLRFVGSSYAGDTITHRFRCRDDACPVVLAWSVTS